MGLCALALSASCREAGASGAAGERPDASVESAAELAPGITVGDLRRATDEVSARAESKGERPGPAFAACKALAARGLVARCMNLGSGIGGNPVDRASFELPDPRRGRGLIQHYATAAGFEAARSAFALFEKEYGTFVADSRRALLIFSGAEALGEAERQAVREVMQAQ
jgi:hypothetical protein